MDNLRHSNSRFWPMLLWMALIFTLSSIPGRQLPKIDLPSWDKLAHLAVYAVLGFLTLHAIQRKLSSLKIVWIAFLICLAFGLSDEFHQSFVPGRFVSAWDLLADTLGSLLGIWYYRRISMKRSSAHPIPDESETSRG